MNTLDSEVALNTSLQRNFDGKTDFKEGWRNGVKMNSSTDSVDGFEITDRWIAHTKTTAGQEIISVNGIPKFTRVYIGGVIPAKMDEAGTTEEEVSGFLKDVILEHSDSIRLRSDFSFEHGNWSYYYNAERLNDDLKLGKGAERIYYTSKDGNKVLVFVHHFMFAPILEG